MLPTTQDYANLVTERPDYYIRRTSDCREYFTKDTRRELQNLMRVIFKSER